MKYALIFGTAALAIAGFVYFLLFSTPNEDSKTQDNPVAELAEKMETEKKKESLSGLGTLEALSLRGEDLECVISYTEPETAQEFEGTYFVSQGNIRGDFLTPAPDFSGQILSSVIISGTMMYVWSEIEGGLYGIKADLSVVDNEMATKNEPIAMDAEVNYTCKDWENVDRTVFNPPSTVLFQDMSQIMNSGMEYGTVYDEQPVMEI